MLQNADPFFMIKGIDYDCLGSEIRCNADRDGASIFEVEADGRRVVRVLTHYQDDAEKSARDVFPKWFVEEEELYGDEDDD